MPPPSNKATKPSPRKKSSKACAPRKIHSTSNQSISRPSPKKSRRAHVLSEGTSSDSASDEERSSTSEDSRPKRKRKRVLSSSNSHADEDIEFVPPIEARRAANMAQNAMVKQLLGLTPPPTTSMTADIAVLKEKVKTLETTQHKLKRQVIEQDKEIKRLKRDSSYELSSASEFPTHPERVQQSFSPGPLQKQSLSPVKQQSDPLLAGREVDSLRLASAKLQSDAASTALKLMDTIFTTEELVNSNPSGKTKSTDPARQASIVPLDPAGMKYIYDFLDSKWPGSFSDKRIKRKMTQKCTDYYNDARYKHLRRGSQ